MGTMQALEADMRTDMMANWIANSDCLGHAGLEQDDYLVGNELLLNSITDVILVRDFEGRCLKILPTQTANLYLPAEQMLGKTLHETFPPAQANLLLGYIHKALENQQPVSGEYELMVREKLVHFSAVFSPIDNHRVLLVTHDITERKRSENQLELYALIIRSLAEGICLVRADDNTIVYSNPKFETMFGYDVCELIGKDMSILHHAHSYAYAQNTVQNSERERKSRTAELSEAITQYGEFTYEAYSIKKNGDPFWSQVTASILSHPAHGRVYVMVHSDITAEKRTKTNVDLLQALTTGVNQARDLESALNLILSEVSEAHGWSYAEAWLPEQGALVCSSAFFNSICQPDANSNTSKLLQRFRQMSETMVFPLGEGLPGRVYQSQEPEWQVDVSTQSEHVFLRKSLAAECEIKSGLGIPLVADGSVLAVLVFFSQKLVNADFHLTTNLSAIASQLDSMLQRRTLEYKLALAESRLQAFLENA